MFARGLSSLPRFVKSHPVFFQQHARLYARYNTDWASDKQGPLQVFLKRLKEQQGPDYAKRSLQTKLLLDSLRDMTGYRTITPSGHQHVEEFRSSLRAVMQLRVQYPDHLTVAELEEVISPESGVTWRVIHDLLQTGKVSELETLSEVERAALLFSRVHGLGYAYANGFAANGARTLADLLNEDKFFGRKLSNGQKLGIEYLDNMEQMIPRSEVTAIKNRFGKDLKGAGEEFKFEVMGSYRRGEPFSSDVDIVVYHPPFVDTDHSKPVERYKEDSLMGKIKAALIQSGFIQADHILSIGSRKMMVLTGIGECHRQCDIRLCPLNSVPYMLVGNTGDMHLMRILRSQAKRKNWTLNEYGMGPGELRGSKSVVQPGEAIKVKDEQEIFQLLGLPYLEPTQRAFKTYSKLPGYSGSGWGKS